MQTTILLTQTLVLFTKPKILLTTTLKQFSTITLFNEKQYNLQKTVILFTKI